MEYRVMGFSAQSKGQTARHVRINQESHKAMAIDDCVCVRA